MDEPTSPANAQTPAADPVQQGEQPPSSPPRAGDHWDGQGGIYIGAVVDSLTGSVKHHLFRAEPLPGYLMTWDDAVAYARSLDADGHADYCLPTAEEALLLLRFARSRLMPNDWYWTSDEVNGLVVCQYVLPDGMQRALTKMSEGHAWAVRRVPA